MRRNVVKIDEEKCTGCGQCVDACAEGAIELVDGKARLLSDAYCDGLGACLGECPADAITIEERDAEAFDMAAAKQHAQPEPTAAHSACPGATVREMKRGARAKADDPPALPASGRQAATASELAHWPVQLKLVAPNAPFFRDAHLLLAADCVPFALADFHPRFLRGRSVVVGCPKLDDPAFYVEKLTEILKQSSIRSITVLHMEVPCCFGLSRIAEAALAASGKKVPLRDATVSIEGKVKEKP